MNNEFVKPLNDYCKFLVAKVEVIEAAAENKLFGNAAGSQP